MKILFIIDKLGSGGKERRLVELIKGLEKTEISSRIIVLTNVIHYREIFELDTEVIVLERKIRKDPLILLKLFRICRKWEPDIIHAWGSMPAIYSFPIAKLFGIKMINAFIVDAPRKLKRKFVIRAMISFPFSDIIQANSYAGIKAYNVPEKKVNVVHNGFDFDRIENLKNRNEIREKLGIRTRFVVGMTSVFRPHKDYRSFIIAARELIDERDDITFVCVGSGQDFNSIVSMAEGEEKIIFTGETNDVESIVNIFDIGILLTNLDEHGEGISNSIMEYMALGKPVISTEGGGTSELLIEGKTGFLIPDKSPQKLKERIEYLLNNEEKRIGMGAAGKERIRREFSLDNMVEGHISLYYKLLKE